MDRPKVRCRNYCFALLLAVTTVASTGCLHSILATGIYLAQGGNVVPADCEALEGERVVVVCRPPSSHEYRHAGAAHSIGRQVSKLLREHVKNIDVVHPQEVDNWIDEQDWENFKDLGRSVKATRIVYIELDHFDLHKGKTLYQGNTQVKVTVFDTADSDWELWERDLGELLFPHNSGIPVQDTSVRKFRGQFVDIVSRKIAENFYKHDPNADFAMDAVANQ